MNILSQAGDLALPSCEDLRGAPKRSTLILMPTSSISVPCFGGAGLKIEARQLRDLAGVGPSIEANLRSLGVDSVTDLARRSGNELYRELCTKTGARQDPCVLDTFRCAVAQARDVTLAAEQRNWWWWSRQRKSGKLA